MHSLLQDLRFSVRQLIKSPGFTLTAIVSLALGIGATAAVFSVIYAALLHPFPYPDADRIVRLRIFSKESGGRGFNPNGPQIRELQKIPVIDSLLVMDYRAMTLTGREFPENVNVIGLIGNGFSDLKMSLFLGRGILPSDAIDGQDPQPVAVLSYEFWRKHFLGDPNVIGCTIELDHRSYQVVGVLQYILVVNCEHRRRARLAEKVQHVHFARSFIPITGQVVCLAGRQIGRMNDLGNFAALA